VAAAAGPVAVAAAEAAAAELRRVPQVRRRLISGLNSRLGESRARRLAMPVGAIGVVALVIGVLVAAELPASSKGAAQPAKSSGAASVQRRDLVATDTQSGTLGHAGARTVYNRLSGTITWLPAVGAVIKPGEALFKVDNSPVTLFEGATPAYRTLSSSVTSGPDVQELNQSLVSLGYDPSRQIAVNQTWQAATTDAVDRWQAALGETQTGTVTLGQIVFLPGSQLIASVQTVLGSTGSGSAGTGSSSATGASLTTAAPKPQFVSLTTTTTAPRSATTGTTGASGPSGPAGSGNSGGSSNASMQALIALLKAEIAELKKSAAGTGTSASGKGASGAGSSANGSGGGGGGGGGASSSGGSTGASAASAGSAGATAQAVMQTTSTQEVVTVQLDATKQSEAVVGEAVTVQLPDGSTVNGKITTVSPVAQSASSSSSSAAGGGGGSSAPAATIPVTITLTGHTRVSGLDQAAVSVNFIQQRATGVLSVPVTALIATQGGSYAVQEAAAPHRLIPVTPGLFAAGYVQVSGSGVYPGLQVTDSQG
jgi:hypothetical protein